MENDTKDRDAMAAIMAKHNTGLDWDKVPGSHKPDYLHCAESIMGQLNIKGRISAAEGRAAYHAESVRCMSKVFDDIAMLVGLPAGSYGNPDALLDAIENLKK